MLVIPARLRHLFPKGACDQLASGRRAGAPRLQEQGKRKTPSGYEKDAGGIPREGYPPAGGNQYDAVPRPKVRPFAYPWTGAPRFLKAYFGDSQNPQ
jgi:hypothetical protein